MKVTFVYPAIGITGFDTSDSIQMYAGERCWISHGLGLVATQVSRHADVEIIDMRSLKGWSDLSDKLPPSDWFGLSISTLNAPSAKLTIGAIKTKYPNAKIVVGGVDPTMNPQNYKDVICVQGEGEKQIMDLLGFDYKPTHVDREMWDYQKELDMPFTPCMDTPMLTMLAGRGCPYDCGYCQPTERLVHGHYKSRDVQDVLAELRMLKEKYDFKSVLFWDDTFAVNPKWVHEFCEGYKEIGEKLVINVRADIISNNPEMMQELRNVGLHMVLVGIESGSQRILNLLNKGVRISQNKNASGICQDLGVKMFATYMLGLPTETNAEALSTMTLINEIRPEYILPFYYTPIPGTYLFDYCVEKDLLLNGNGTIERTGKFSRTIKGVDYEFLDRYVTKAQFFKKDDEIIQ